MPTLYRSPLLRDGHTVDSDLFGLLTDSQVARLATWSIQTGKPVLEILESSRFMAEQIREDSHQLRLVGTLPHCDLFGSLEPDGSCAT
jgi:hypothetical protein